MIKPSSNEIKRVKIKYKRPEFQNTIVAFDSFCPGDLHVIACPLDLVVIPRVHLLGLQPETVFPSEGLVARPRTCQLGSSGSVVGARRQGSRMPTSPSECFFAETPE